MKNSVLFILLLFSKMQAQTCIRIINNDTSITKYVMGFEEEGINKNDSITEFHIQIDEPQYLYVMLKKTPRFKVRIWVDENTKLRTIHADYKTNRTFCDSFYLDKKDEFLNSKEELFSLNKISHFQLDSLKKEYIKQNPKEFLAVYYLTHLSSRMTYNSFVDLFNSLQVNPAVKKYSYYKNVENYISSNKIKIKKVVFPNDTFYEFKGYTLEDKVIETKEIKSKYLLLYFWFSSCSACKKTTPVLQEFYNSIKDTVDVKVISFTIDDAQSLESWRKVSKEYNFAWTNITDKMGSYGLVAKTYDVMSAPMLVVFENKQLKARYTDALEIKALLNFKFQNNKNQGFKN